MSHIDLNGLAAVIGAIGVALPVLANTVFSIINFFDTRRDRIDRDKIGRKVDAITDHLQIPPGNCQ